MKIYWFEDKLIQIPILVLDKHGSPQSINDSELGTLEWITFNPNYLIRISTVETFNFIPQYTLFLSLWISAHCFLQ